MENSTWAKGITDIVEDPLRFKQKLEIGEDAYGSLRMKKYLLEALDAANGASAGVVAANSSIVASTFFAPSGFLGVIGLGTAATPIGWAVAAGTLGAGLSIVIGRHIVRGNSSRVSVIPDFINTPLDILAVGLFDLIGMLSVKIATIDGKFSQEERDVIEDYFVKEWGYDGIFVKKGLAEIELHADDNSVKDVAKKLADFKKSNPDCNYNAMSKEILRFLNEISFADDVLDEREEMAIENVKIIFDEVGSFSIKEVATDGINYASDIGKQGADFVSKQLSPSKEAFTSLGEKISSTLKNTSKFGNNK